FIAVGTTSPDMIFPTVGNIVQHRLGCRRAGSVDMLAACAGSVYSLSIGSQFIQTGKYRTVLCIGAETLSRITDFTDRGTCVLLADGAGAAVLQASEDGAGVLDADLYSDGKYWEYLYQPGGGSRHPATAETVAGRLHYAKMKGNEVFKVAVRMFGDCAATIRERNGVGAARPPGPRPPRRPRGPASAASPARRARGGAPADADAGRLPLPRAGLPGGGHGAGLRRVLGRGEGRLRRSQRRARIRPGAAQL